MTTQTTAPSPTLRSTPVDHKGAGFLAATMAIAARTAKKFLRTPMLIVGGTVSSVMFLLIFRYVFGGAISTTGRLSYVDFVAPGFIVTGGLFSAMNSGTGVAEDLQQGLIDRLRSLPIPQVTIVCGRIVADTALAAWGLLITAAVAFAVGFRLHGGILHALEGFALAVIWAMAFCWLFTALGFFAGSAQGAQSLGFLVFPLTFVSSAYVPVQTMPGWMQAFANHQPLTVMVDTARILAEGKAAEMALHHGVGYYLPVAMLWTVGIIAVAVPITVWKLNRT